MIKDIRVRDIINLIDWERYGDERVYIAPTSDSNEWVLYRTNSILITDEINKMEVESLGIHNGIITIFLKKEVVVDE